MVLARIVLFVVLLIMFVRLMRREALFLPLPMDTVKKIMSLANVRKGDVVYDLGCGDGRILIESARRGANVVGVENSRILAWLCRRNVDKSGMEKKIKIIRGNLFEQNLKNATVVVVYLSQKLNDKLKPKLENKLKRGTRVVSADHEFVGWKEIKKEKAGHFYLHLYKV